MSPTPEQLRRSQMRENMNSSMDNDPNADPSNPDDLYERRTLFINSLTPEQRMQMARNGNFDDVFAQKEKDIYQARLNAQQYQQEQADNEKQSQIRGQQMSQKLWASDMSPMDRAKLLDQDNRYTSETNAYGEGGSRVSDPLATQTLVNKAQSNVDSKWVLNDDNSNAVRPSDWGTNKNSLAPEQYQWNSKDIWEATGDPENNPESYIYLQNREGTENNPIKDVYNANQKKIGAYNLETGHRYGITNPDYKPTSQITDENEQNLSSK